MSYFSNRVVYYSAFPVIEQGVKGDWNYQLKEVYHIWIMDHVLPDSDPREMIHEVKLRYTETYKVFDKSLTYLLVETPKFTKEETELETELDRWIFVLTNLTTFQEIPVTLKDDPIFKEFFMLAELLKMEPEERGIYLASLKERWDEYSLRETALVQGKAEGKAEGKIEMAIEMKKHNEPIEKISRYTGLGVEEIERL